MIAFLFDPINDLFELFNGFSIAREMPFKSLISRRQNFENPWFYKTSRPNGIC
jgi:hypothetical protein